MLANYYSVKVIGAGFLMCKDLFICLRTGKRKIVKEPEILKFTYPKTKRIDLENYRDEEARIW